ncbi:MAG: PAS domain S-box protein [Longimicrobiales bacterium]
MHETLSDQPHLIALSDADGLVIRMWVGPGLDEDDLRRSNLSLGASWHEKDIGTNGIGTCLATGEPVILIGPEHFQSAYLGWTCIGVPIRGDASRDSFLGALDLSLPNEATNAHSWGWALSVARGIEASLLRPTPPAAAEPGTQGPDGPLPAVQGVLEGLAGGLGLSPSYARFLEEARSDLGRSQAKTSGAVQEIVWREWELLERLLDSIPVMIVLYDPSIQEVRVNRHLERVAGWNNEDLRELDIMEACYPDPAYRREVRSFMNSLDEGWRDFWLTAKDGSVLETSWANLKLTDKRQVGIGIDITDRTLAERALRESEARFRAVVDLVPDLLWRSDAEGSTTWYNHRWAEYTGQARTDGWGWVEVLHPSDREPSRAAYQRAAETGESFEREHRIRRHDGVYRWFLARAEPVRDKSGTVHQWFGTATDIHDRRTALETLEARVEDRTREVRRLAGMLTLVEQRERQRISQILHDDLQQLLYAIQMKLASSPEHAMSGQPEAWLLQTERSLELLDRAINCTRQLTVELSPPLLEEEGLADAVQWLRTQMRDLHGIEVEIRGDLEPETISKDLQVLLFQSVRELLFNVAKHAETNRARVRIGSMDGQVRIEVIDEGCGFDPGAVKHAGDALPFGFGIFNVRRRLQLLGGRLEIHSAPGEGTRVVIYAPKDGFPESDVCARESET